MAEQLLKIGQLAAQAGVSTRTVDHYTNLGLLIPAGRTPGNFRLYNPNAIDRISAIRALEAHGINLTDISNALNNHVDSDPDAAAALELLQSDLEHLQLATASAATEFNTLLTVIAIRAHALITTAIDLTVT